MSKKNYTWIGKSNEIISCDEKLKVLNENFEELESNFQNFFDDAILMGCDEKDFKNKVLEMVQNSKFSFGK